jgi:hypothetical protein
MCRRFTTERASVTGSANDVGFGAAGRAIGLVPDGMPNGTTSPVGRWHVAGIAVELADTTVGDPINEPHVSIPMLGVGAL